MVINTTSKKMKISAYFIFVFLCTVKLVVKCYDIEEKETNVNDQNNDSSTLDPISLTSPGILVKDILKESEFFAKSDEMKDHTRIEITISDFVTEAISRTSNEVASKIDSFYDKNDGEATESKVVEFVSELYNKENRNSSKTESKSNDSQHVDQSDNDSTSQTFRQANSSELKLLEDINRKNETPDYRAGNLNTELRPDESDKSFDITNSKDSLQTDNSNVDSLSLRFDADILPEIHERADSLENDESDISTVSVGGTERMLNPAIIHEAAKSAVNTVLNMAEIMKSVAKPDVVSKTMTAVNDFGSRRNYGSELNTPNFYQPVLRTNNFSFPLEKLHNTGTPVVTKIADNDIVSSLDTITRKMIQSFTKNTASNKEDTSKDNPIRSNDLLHNAYLFVPVSSRNDKKILNPQLLYNHPNIDVLKAFNKQPIPYYPDLYKPFQPNYLNVGFGQLPIPRFSL